MAEVTLEKIREAQDRISTYVRATPLLRFDYLSTKMGKNVLLKCESLQRTGSFKIRGAANCMLNNLAQAKRCGVIAASAGNHAQGVAAIASILGVKATIVMPTITPAIKVSNTKRWGAEVELVGTVYDEAFEHAMKLAQAKGYLFVHPFNDPHVIAGQGTVGLEMLADPQFADVKAVVVSVGGGGLSTGVAMALKAVRPDIKIYGVGARNAPSAWRSYQVGSLVEEPVEFTLAEGVAAKKVDATMLNYMKEALDDFFVIGEDSLALAIALLAEHGKLVIEGAGALPVAAVLEGLIPEENVALILSGGNIDLPALTNVVQRGLAEQNRLVRLMIAITDRPGGLNAVTEVLAAKGANIIQVFHQRGSLHTRFGEAEIEVDLETRGTDHTAQITQALTERGFRVDRVS